MPWPSGSSRASSHEACARDGLDAAERRPRERGRDVCSSAERDVEPDLVRCGRRPATSRSTARLEALDVADDGLARRSRESGRRRPRPARGRVSPPSCERQQCHPTPPARSASRGVASTVGGASSVGCRARIRASLCSLIRKRSSTPSRARPGRDAALPDPAAEGEARRAAAAPERAPASAPRSLQPWRHEIERDERAAAQRRRQRASMGRPRAASSVAESERRGSGRRASRSVARSETSPGPASRRMP